MSDSELDKAIKNALEELAYDEFLEAQQADLPEIIPSPRFQRRMHRLLRNPRGYAASRRRPVPLKIARTAAAVVLVMLTTFSVAMAVPSARAVVLGAFTEWYDEYISLRFHGNYNHEVENNAPIGWTLTALPEGYTETVAINNPAKTKITYSHTSHPQITFSYRLTSIQRNLGLDTEHTTPTEITLNGHEAYRFDQISPEYPNHLVWYDENQKYLFCLSSTLPMDTLLELAMSLTKNS